MLKKLTRLVHQPWKPVALPLRSPSVLFPLLGACVLLAFLASGPAAASEPIVVGPVVVEPGGTLLFTEPDSVEGVANPGIPLAFQGGAFVDTETDSLQSSVHATLPLRRSASRITARYGFQIDGGSGHDTLLLTQISGHLDMRGFMTITGLGQAHAEATLRVRDVTDGPGGPIIASHTISRHDLEGEFTPAIQASIGVQGGAPYIGGSFGMGVDFELSIGLELVRDEQQFGFTAWLRRGRTYDLELVFETGAILGGLPQSTASATFYAPLGKSLPISNPADPANWMDAIGTFASHDLPNINIPSRNPLLGSGSYRFPLISTWWGDYGNVTRPIGLNFIMNPLNRNFSDTHDALDFLGIPRNIDALVTNHLGLDTKLAGLDEDITSPGVRLSGLRLVVEPDSHELLTAIQATLAKRIDQPIPRDAPAIPKDGRPMLAPGQSLEFSAPDGAAVHCNDGVAAGNVAYCDANSNNDRLQFIQSADVGFTRSTSLLLQWNDFDVHAGNNPGAAVVTQISGSLTMQGILLVLGLGQAEVDINLVVRDITDAEDSPGTAPIVMSHPIRAEELAGEITVSSGVSMEIQGGAPFAGGGFNYDFGLENTSKRRLVRASEDFVFVAMLQRGHTYRLELEVESMAKRGAGPGLSLASFFPAPVPNLVDPDMWAGLLQDRLGPGLPDVSIPRAALTGAGTISLPVVETWAGTYLGQTVSMPLNLDLRPLGQHFSSVQGFQSYMGLPNNVDALLDAVIDSVFDELALLEEEFTAPGIEMTHLSVAMQDDLVLLLRQAKSALESGHFSMVRGDVTGNGQVNAVDVQLVINAALGINIDP
mgnify:CR=1 FL=1